MNRARATSPFQGNGFPGEPCKGKPFHIQQLVAQGIVLMLAWVQWINPQWGWVLPAAVLLPLAAHLMSQRSGRLAYFPAVRFIAKAVAQQARWRAPRQWLLLLLRMLILALVIAAFAQPMWWRDNQTTSQRHQGLATVLIVDASASMQRTFEGSSLFDTARTQALAALASLDPMRDRAMLIILDASPSPVLPRMSANFSAMRDALLALKPTWEQGNLAAALSLAAKPAWDPADLASTAPLTIHLYSDMQRTQWPVDAELRTILADRTFVPHYVGESAGQSTGESVGEFAGEFASGENLALHQMTLTPAQPVRGQAARVSVDAAYYAPVSRTPLEVNVRMTSMNKTHVRRVTLAPQRTSRVSFPWQPTDAGAAYIAMSIEPASRSINDTLQADNQTGLHVHIATAQNVALVTQANVDDPSSAAYYLARALMPDADASTNEVRLQVWSASQLETILSSALGSASTTVSKRDWPTCIVMVETGTLDAQALRALEQYMAMGGGVWWLLDSSAAAESLGKWQGNQQSDGSHDGKTGQYPLSPVLSVDADGRTGKSLHAINRVDGVPHIGRGVFDRPPLDVFEGSARAALTDIYFMQTFEGMLAPDAESLLDFAHVSPGTNGQSGADTQASSPVLSWRPVGDGRLALLTASISPALSNLVKAPVFLPLVHQMVRSLSPQQSAVSNPTPGGSAVISLDANDIASGVYLLQPDGSRTGPITNVTRLKDDAAESVPRDARRSRIARDAQQGKGAVSLPHLAQVGRYDLHAQSDNRLLGGVQVELAPAESDPASEIPQPALRKANDATIILDAQDQPNAAYINDHNDNKTSPAASVSTATIRAQGKPLWPYCLMLAALLMTLESLVSAGLWEHGFFLRRARHGHRGRRAHPMHEEKFHA